MIHRLKMVSITFGLIFLWGCSAAATETAPTQQAARPSATNTVSPVEQGTQATPTDPPNTATPTVVGEADTDEAQQDEQSGGESAQEEETAQPDESNKIKEATPTTEPAPVGTPTPAPTKEMAESTDAGIGADVLSVEAKGESGLYNFSVEISSPDTGCEQFADWWEVLSEDGQLLYRRILLHSHVNEQPFVRSGGPVEITADDIVWVRAHMNIGGYGGQVLKGAPATGFEPVEPAPGFAAGAENLAPLPGGCAF